MKGRDVLHAIGDWINLNAKAAFVAALSLGWLCGYAARAIVG